MATLPEGPAVSQVDVSLGEASVLSGTGTTAMEPMPTAERPLKVIRPPTFSVRTIFSGVRTLAQYSDLLYTLSLFRLNVRYKQSVLGWSWAILQPLALMCIYTVIFTRVTTIATGGTPYPLFVFAGLLPWIFFSASISSAVQGLVLHPNLLTKMYFPREIIPLSYLAAGLADFCIASLILLGLIVHYHVALTWNLLYAIPIVLLLGGFAAAIALFFSAIQVRFRAVGLAMPFVL
jgi:lipopolysaccharide transport system permease protein